jgi:hypothetical protein
MSSNDKHDLERNKQMQAFNPPLIHEEGIEPSAEVYKEDNAEKKVLTEEKANKEKSEVLTKEALLRVTSGLL